MLRLSSRMSALVFLLSVFSLCFFISPERAHASVGNATILTKEDVARFEKLTFYETKESNIIGTVPEGIDSKSSSAYRFLNSHRVVSTGSGSVVAEYGHIGQFHGKDISVIITFYGFTKKNSSEFGERDGRYIGIPYCFRNNFFYDGDSLSSKIVFYYSDDINRTPIDMTNAFLVINGLNVDEFAGMKSGNQAYLSENTQLRFKTTKGYECYGYGPQGKSDHCISGSDDRKYQLNGVYYEEDISNPLYYVCSVLFTLNGTENDLYIEDARKTAGCGIGWCLDLTTLHVTYNIKTHVENGTITPDITDIIYNTDQTVSYSPDDNYVLDSVTVDGTPVDTSSVPEAYCFKNITQDHEISVVYKLPYKKITTEAVNGSITPSDENVLFGTDKDIAYSPDEGYVLDSISIDGENSDPKNNKDAYSFKQVQADHHIKVVYGKPEAPVKKVLDKNGEFINEKLVSVGDILTYEISFKNPLSQKAEVVITDSIPEFTEFQSATDGGTRNDNTVVWQLSVDPSSERSVRMNVKVLESAEGKVISNYAMMDIAGVKLMSNTVKNPLPAAPLKRVTRSGDSIDGQEVAAGETVTYRITVKNTSFTEQDIKVEDSVSDHLQIRDISDDGKSDGNKISWLISGIPAGETRTVDFTATTKGGDYPQTVPNVAYMMIGSQKLPSNKVSITIPAVAKNEVLGEQLPPVVTPDSDVLGERNVPTGDNSNVLVLILTAMCAFAGIIIVRIKYGKDYDR